MRDGTPPYPISPQDAGFQAPDLSAARPPFHESVALLHAVYGPEAVRVDRVINGVGIYTVPSELTARLQTTSYIDEVRAMEDGRLAGVIQYGQEHALGHFRPEIGTVIPGVAMLRSAYEALARIHLNSQNEPRDYPKQITGFKSLSFKNPVLPGQTISYVPSEVSIISSGMFSEFIQGSITGSRGEDTVLELAGVEVAYPFPKGYIEEIPRALPTSELLEIGVLPLALKALEGRSDLMDESGQPTVLPMFVGIGETHIFDTVRAGDTLHTRSEITRPLKGETGVMRGNIQILRGGEVILESQNLTGMVLKRDAALEKFGLGARQ